MYVLMFIFWVGLYHTQSLLLDYKKNTKGNWKKNKLQKIIKRLPINHDMFETQSIYALIQQGAVR